MKKHIFPLQNTKKKQQLVFSLQTTKIPFISSQNSEKTTWLLSQTYEKATNVLSKLRENNLSPSQNYNKEFCLPVKILWK